MMPAVAPKRILLVRLSAMGDILFATPLAAAFRHRWPEARIAWLTQPEYASLLGHNPSLDEVVEWPLPRLLTLLQERRVAELWREAGSAISALRERRFDLAVDLQGLLKSALPVRLSGAKVRIGLASREGSGMLMTRVVDPGPSSERISSEYLHLAQALGLPVGDFRMAVHYGDDDARSAEGLIAAHRLSLGYIVICPFTTRPQKHWLAARWGQLAHGLQTRWQLPVVMLGGPGDRAPAAAIAGAAGVGRVIDLTGRTSLPVAAALIDRCRALVGVDTGLTHMGIALRRPTLALFGSTCPYLDTARPDATVIYHPRDCSPCRRRPSCGGRFDCMRDIGVDEVLAALDRLAGSAR
jgi:heptosyltransferase-1